MDGIHSTNQYDRVEFKSILVSSLFLFLNLSGGFGQGYTNCSKICNYVISTMVCFNKKGKKNVEKCPVLNLRIRKGDVYIYVFIIYVFLYICLWVVL